jgi:hypothetical protein
VNRFFCKYLLIIVASYIVIPFIIPINFDFPLMDDWSYMKIAKVLAFEHKLIMTDWPSMSLVFQVFCSAILIKSFGSEYFILHLFSYCMGFFAVITTYYLYRILKINHKKAFLTSLILFSNPLFFCLNFTFMTDIFFLLLSLLSIFFITKAFSINDSSEQSSKIVGGKVSFILAILFVIFAILVRQTALIISLSAGLLLFIKYAIFRKKDTLSNKLDKAAISWATIFLVIPIAILVIFQLWMYYQFGISRSLSEKIDFLKNEWHWSLITYRTYAIFCYLGLFLAPLLIPMVILWKKILPSSGSSKFRETIFKNRSSLIILTIFLCLFLYYNFTKGENSTYFHDNKNAALFPYFENMISNFTIGPLTLRDTYILHYPPYFELPYFIIFIISFAACVLGSIVFDIFFTRSYHIFKQLLSKRSEEFNSNLPEAFILLISFFYILQLYLYNKAFDRYILFLIPLFSFILLKTYLSGKISEPKIVRENKLFYFGSILLIIILFSISIMGTHDYISWNQARWKGINSLFDKGISPDSIDGGFEFNGLYTYDPSSTYNPSNRNLSWWWVVNDEYIISFNELPDYRVIEKIGYKSCLSKKEQFILVLKRI